jgi:hypothetical protein
MSVGFVPPLQRLITTGDSSLNLLTLLILHADIEARRQLLKLIRVGDVPKYNSFLYDNLTTITRVDHFRDLCYQRPPVNIKIEQFEDMFLNEMRSPIRASLLSMMLRNLPLKTPRWSGIEDAARVDSFLKEFRATQRPRKLPVIDYRSVFQSHNTQWHPDVPLRPALQRDIRSRLTAWKADLSKRILYPRYSKKTMGCESSFSLGTLLRPDFSYGEKLTTFDLEEYYHRTGQTISGPVEMRQAWFFNDLKPRTYFANGASTYFASRYLQTIFNTLLDSFPHTHRKSRFRMRRLRFGSHDRVIVYDYSSFTSSMSEQYYFLNALAEFCKGTNVTILDTFYGLITISLGDLIYSYNEVCNNLPEFRIAESLRDLMDIPDLSFLHQCAGFLGVYGNLASCTILHGLNLAILSGEYDRCSCVGDDAMGSFEACIYHQEEEGEIIETNLSTRDIFNGLETCGEISEPKTRVFDPMMEVCEDDSRLWTYLKRSLDRVDDELLLGDLLDFPSLGLIIHEECKTSRRPNFDLTPENVAPRFAIQAFTLLRKAHALVDSLTEQDAHTIFTFLRRSYSLLGLPLDGWLFGCQDEGHFMTSVLKEVTILPAVPRSSEEDFHALRRDPIPFLVDSLRMDGWNAPVVVMDFADDFHSAPGAQFESRGKRVLTVLEDLGYIGKQALVERVDGVDIAHRLVDFLDRRTSILYRFEILKELPFWVRDVASRGF